jgi:hypothetical protein
MLKQRPTLDIARSNRYKVCTHIEKVKSHFIQSGRDNITQGYDRHPIECTAERMEFIDSRVADNTYLFPIAERMEGGVRSPNPTQRDSKADNEWLASTLLPGGMNPSVYRHHILSSGRITAVSMMMDFIMP